jgi:hypothetical protein
MKFSGMASMEQMKQLLPPGLPEATSVIRADSEICRVFSAGVDVLGWIDMGDVKTGLQTPKQHQKGLL